MSDPLKDFENQLDAAMAPHLQGRSDRQMAARITRAAAAGGSEAARKVAAEMTPEQAKRVTRYLR